MFSLKPIIASRGYHVYKETPWSNAKLNIEVKVELETDAKSLSADPYACAIKARHSYFVGWKTAEHIPREISRYVYFFIKEENGKVFGTLKSLKYNASPIRSGGFEVPLSLTFRARKNGLPIPWRNSFKIFTLSNIAEISQLTPAIARRRKKMIIKLSFLNQKTRKMRRGKKIRQNRFRNRQGHTCSYHNRLINSIFNVLF